MVVEHDVPLINIVFNRPGDGIAVPSVTNQRRIAIKDQLIPETL